MTGFGGGVGRLGTGRVVVEVRTVNGRFLDVRVRMPRELADLTAFIEAEARRRLSRGRCEIVVRTEGAIFPVASLDKSRARAAYRALLELRDELAPGADVPFSMLSTIPDLFVSDQVHNAKDAEGALQTALDAALTTLEQMREEEGKRLAKELADRAKRVSELCAGMAERAPTIVQAYRARLEERLARIRSGPDASSGIEPTRLHEELVWFAERSDIAEELSRITIHVEQLTRYLDAPDAAGRRLDFLLQEMVREINTIGAKSQDTEIAHTVVELKTEIERMREQVQNVE